MHLSKFNECFSHRISGGSEYCWKSFGLNARYLDFESEFAHGSLVFDAMTQTVYIADIDAKKDGDDNLPGPYRWINPDHRQGYIDECKERGIEPFEAWDNVNYIELELAEDFLEKAHAIFNNLPFDKRIVVSVDLDDDVILKLAMEAHKRDITINKMVEIVLQQAIDNHKGITNE
jgi:hypothetical protein